MFDWKDFHKVATVLSQTQASHPLSEACYRSAISRVYYYALHKAKTFAVNNLGFVEDPNHSGDRHSELIRYLIRNNNYAGNYLGKLKKLRNDSDYDCRKSVGQSEVKLCSRFLSTVLSHI